METFSLRRIAVVAYGPTLLAGIGTGAMAPAIPLLARDLGASVGVAGAVVAALTAGVLVMDLPAGELAARVGERRALLLATGLGALVTLVAAHAHSVAVLALMVFLYGGCASVFGLARMTYLSTVVPPDRRARALSLLGGTMRIGRFVGPFAAALAVHRIGLRGAFDLSAAMDAIAFLVVLRQPELPGTQAGTAAAEPGTVLGVVREHHTTLLTLGVGALAVSAVRTLRDVVLPLWGDHIGLDAATTALVFGIAGGAEILLFYPAGWVMDRFGRAWTAVPAMVGLGIGFLLLSLTHTLATFTAVAALVGLSNGIGAGILMTLGADAAPAGQVSRFLAAWRLVADIGSVGGPALLSAATIVAPLAVGVVGTGVAALGGAAWLAYWVPRSAHSARRAPRSTTGSGATRA